MSTDTPTPAPIKTYVRCKACGFVIEQSRLKDVCPACGVKRAMFIPDTEKISEKRRMILDAHIHPVIVHFPQAFAASLFALCLVHVVMPGFLASHIWVTIQVVAACLPVVGIAAFVSGLCDGTVRFRKLTAPLLRLKIACGSAFAICAVLLCVAVFAGFPGFAGGIALVVLSAGCVGTSAVLGKVGSSLAHARFGG